MLSSSGLIALWLSRKTMGWFPTDKEWPAKSFLISSYVGAVLGTGYYSLDCGILELIARPIFFFAMLGLNWLMAWFPCGMGGIALTWLFRLWRSYFIRTSAWNELATKDKGELEQPFYMQRHWHIPLSMGVVGTLPWLVLLPRMFHP